MKLLLPFAILAVAAAQGPAPGPALPMEQPGDNEALRRYLNLSDAQVRQMREATAKARQQTGEKMKALGPQIQEKRNALNALLAKDNADPAAVGKAVLELEALEKQMRQSRDAGRDAALAVLTPDQRTRFKAIEEAALLPEATREATRMGLVPGPPQGPGMQGMREPRMTGRRGPGPGMRQGMMPGPQAPDGPAGGMRPRGMMRNGPGPIHRPGPLGPQGPPPPPPPPEE